MDVENPPSKKLYSRSINDQLIDHYRRGKYKELRTREGTSVCTENLFNNNNVFFYMCGTNKAKIKRRDLAL